MPRKSGAPPVVFQEWLSIFEHLAIKQGKKKVRLSQNLFNPSSPLHRYYSQFYNLNRVDRRFLELILNLNRTKIPGTETTIGRHLLDYINEKMGSGKAFQSQLSDIVFRVTAERAKAGAGELPGEFTYARFTLRGRIDDSDKWFKALNREFTKITGGKLNLHRGHVVSKSFAFPMAAILLKKPLTVDELIRQVNKYIPAYVQYGSWKKGTTEEEKAEVKQTLADMGLNTKIVLNVKSGEELEAINSLRRAFKSGKVHFSELTNSAVRQARLTFWNIILPHGNMKDLEQEFSSKVTPKLRIKTGYLRKYTQLEVKTKLHQEGKVLVKVPRQRWMLYKRQMLTYSEPIVTLLQNAVNGWWGKYFDPTFISPDTPMGLLDMQFSQYEGPPESEFLRGVT